MYNTSKINMATTTILQPCNQCINTFSSSKFTADILFYYSSDLGPQAKKRNAVCEMPKNEMPTQWEASTCG